MSLLKVRRSVFFHAMAALFVVQSVFMVQSACLCQAAEPKLRAYIGTYTRGEKGGVHTCLFDTQTGELSDLKLAGQVDSPSFVALAPNGKHLYAVSERAGGSVYAFAVNRETGELTELNHESAQGSGPCHLVVDPSGKYVLAANYGSGNVVVLPILPDGRLRAASSVQQHSGSSVNKARQQAPHAHCIHVSPNGRYVLASDLGIDRLVLYSFDNSTGTLAPHDPPGVPLDPGAGPRHFAFSKDGRFGYSLNELHMTVTAFAIEPDAFKFTALQTLPTTPGEKPEGGSTAEILVHPSGKFVYASNRGANTIAVFSVEEDGRLKPVDWTPTGGRTPRNFVLDPEGQFLLAENQDSNDIHVFSIDQGTGRLTPTGKKIECPSPVCMRWLPPATE
jgi:6-phosphogluconolactonase